MNIHLLAAFWLHIVPLQEVQYIITNGIDISVLLRHYTISMRKTKILKLPKSHKCQSSKTVITSELTLSRLLFLSCVYHTSMVLPTFNSVCSTDVLVVCNISLCYLPHPKYVIGNTRTIKYCNYILWRAVYRHVLTWPPRVLIGEFTCLRNEICDNSKIYAQLNFTIHTSFHLGSRRIYVKISISSIY